LIPPTVVANIDKRHSYETALAYQEVGALHRFVTGLYLASSESLGPMRRLRIGRRIGKRSDQRLRADLVKSFAIPDLMGLAVDRLIGDALWFHPLQVRNAIFDRRAAECLEGATIVHGFETTTARTFARAKRLGLSTILDAPIVHPATWTRIYHEEILPLVDAKDRSGAERRVSVALQRKLDEIALADIILSPSEWAASSYRENVPASPTIRIVPYGTNVRPGETDRPPGKLRLLCVTSGLGYRKGTHVLLEAFAPLHKEAELWLAGSILPELKGYLASYGQSVRILGHLGPTQLQEVFDQCHAFVFPSLCESASLAVLEALGQGLPVVITERCGVPIENGSSGLMVPPNQAAPLTAAMARLRERDLRVFMGAKAKELARRLSWAEYRAGVRAAAESLSNRSGVGDLAAS
jgi:glycosyltransferase involved in cell wall biosynthesis